MEVAEYILSGANISVVPWDDSGSYLRFSVTFSADDENEKEVITQIERRLKTLDFVF